MDAVGPDAGDPSRTSTRRSAERRHEIVVLGRTLLVACLLVVAYYLLPFDRPVGWETVIELVVGLLVVLGLVLMHVRQTLRSPRPGMRAAGALLTTVPLFVLLFSSAYFVLERSVPGSFDQPLTKTDALYFTVTVLGTVGFGDIVGRTQVARILTVVQIALDFVFIGVAVRILLGTARVAITRQHGDPGTMSNSGNPSDPGSTSDPSRTSGTDDPSDPGSPPKAP